MQEEINKALNAILHGLILVAVGLFMTSCGVLGQESTEAAQARSLLDRIEFDEDEYGEFTLSGQIDVNPLPLISTNININLRKVKPAPNEEQ